MSNYLAIATVTAALRQLILQGLKSASWGFAYDIAVTTTPLDVARSPSYDAIGQINLFLYHASPNTAWRNEPSPTQVKQGEIGIPPLALDLRYLITAYAPENNGVEVHRLLGCALSVLHDHPILSSKELAGALVNSDVHEQVERVRLIPLDVSVEEMASLWNSFQKSYSLSMAWQASLVLIDSRRSARAALPVLVRKSTDVSRDGELAAVPSIEPVVPGIDSVKPIAQQVSARLGETLAIVGHLLVGAEVRLIFSHSRWNGPKYISPSSITDSALSVALPSRIAAKDEWPAGSYSLSVGVTRRLGETEHLTNELPFSLAPTITSINPTSGAPVGDVLALKVNVSPKVWVGQRVCLIVGDRTFAPQPFLSATDTLQFSLKGISHGVYRLRLRVDGVDSIIVDKTTIPPSFVGPELTVL